MKNVDIIYLKYLDEEHKPTIGGVQTYITDLSRVIVQMGGCVRIVQFSESGFQHRLEDRILVEGFMIPNGKNAKRYQQLYDKAVLTRNGNEAITIFATDNIIPHRIGDHCLAIQHGIFWDVPRKSTRSLRMQLISRFRQAYATIARLKHISTLVCVDYNFLNWYRTQVSQITGSAIVIPNYTRIADPLQKPQGRINIIFARRLFDYRGTRVFTDAIKQLLQERDDIHVTVAGSGPDEEWMKQRLQQYQNVTFTKYESGESIQVHGDKHIAVVPTVGSEGTSLSLLEAMSAQCAVICTDVGGLTNIVLDGYNGLMVSAGDVHQLSDAIKRLIDNPTLRQSIAEKGYETAKTTFSHERWIAGWENTLRSAGFQ